MRTGDVVMDYCEHMKGAIPIEEYGVAWRSFDARVGEFVWRLKEKRWESAQFTVLHGHADFDAYHSAKDHVIVYPYFRTGTFFCCHPDHIPGARLADGPTIESQVRLAERMLEEQNREAA